MGKSVQLPLVAELREENAELRSMLERLTEKVERANRIRHSGGRLIDEDWSELYSLTNEARGTLAADLSVGRGKKVEKRVARIEKPGV
jgi:hypothetical protein